MEDSRQSTVLFADVSGSTQLYQAAGDTTAHGAISGYLELMRKAVEGARGRVVKTIGDEVMALFPSADAAVAAAATMLGAVDALPAVGASKLGLRVGLQAGPVIQHGEDVFGDTVNLASRLVEQAIKGQIITTEETAQLLNPVYRMFTRKLYSIQVKGKADGIALCEVLWFASGERTAFDGFRPRVRTSGLLRLKYLGQETVRRRENESVTLGRESGCGLTVADHLASRRHCTIERRQDKWVLKDHSSNGTFVTVEGDAEIMLQREEMMLRRSGWISLGHPRAEGGEAVEYTCA